ncbi:MAG: glutaminase [Alphaproteobacteria bacterium]|nr:MAG: glutaminase [Alphaproteobacteria bacterium]
MDLNAILNEINHEIRPLLGQGKVADYIPALATVDPGQFGMVVTTNDGQIYAVGDAEQKFSIQSISKVFSFTLALKADPDALCRRVWREPSGNPFNSLIQLEYEAGIPRNPFINAGAIVVTDSLISHFGGQDQALSALITFIKETADTPDIEMDHKVAISEMHHGYKNISSANLMKSFGNIHNEVDTVVRTYFHHCSVTMTARELARSLLYLSHHGTDPLTGTQHITPAQTKQINSLMLTCGHYNASGDFAYRVGLPGKSGVGGGIIAVVPGKMTLAVFSPALNEYGNSFIGTQALDLFTTKTGFSIF